MAVDGATALKDVLPTRRCPYPVIWWQNKQISNQIPKGLTYSPKSAYKPALAMEFLKI